MALLRSAVRLANRVVPHRWLPSLSSRFYALLEPDVALTRLHDGQYLFVDPCDEQISAHLIARGRWEPHVERVVRRVIRRGYQVIEIGANMGYYTLIMADLVGPHGRIESYEANPRFAVLLKRSVEFNGYSARIGVHAQAASDRAGTIAFMISRRNGGAGTVAQAASDIGGDTATIEVQSIRLDEVYPDGVFDLIRCDAEGAEGLVLDGARALIARSPTITLCIEWNLAMLAARSDVSALLRGLEEQGFNFWRIEGNSALTKVETKELLSFAFGDLIISRQTPPAW